MYPMSEKINNNDLNTVCITKRAASGPNPVLLYTAYNSPWKYKILQLIAGPSGRAV